MSVLTKKYYIPLTHLLKDFDMDTPTFGVYLTGSATAATRELICRFGLHTHTEKPYYGYYLLADANGLSLCRAGEKGQVRADFTNGTAQYRYTKGRSELIAKAVNHTTSSTVWDATGGLGRDAFVLATLGLHIEIFEQNPIAACLLADGLIRAHEYPHTAAAAQRIKLHFGDACTLMPQLARTQGCPDVVYLDPMYPASPKSSAVKKEMAYFHSLIGSAQNEAELLSTARLTAQKRIVVKRPRLGTFLNHQSPAYQYTGKSTRFDVYLPSKLP